MDPKVSNLLYDRPELYDLVYPEPDESTPQFCLRMFERHRTSPVQSILDIGCGTGRDLAVLARTCPECWGIDYLPQMVEFMKRTRPQLHCEEGDMRTVRLGRTFDAILCLGSALMYALTDEDLDATLDTFAAHADDETVLILDLLNAAGFLPGGSFQGKREFGIDTPQFKAKAVSCHSFGRRNQRLIRHRTWQLPDGQTVEDYCEYRLHLPLDLTYRLRCKGFHVVDMFDNKELREGDLKGGTLYVTAVFKGR